MRCLISGGSGFLGSTLVPALLDAGHEVTVLDNFRFNQNSLAHVCHNPRLSIVRGDARDIDPSLVWKADVIIPLAAIVGAPACDADRDSAHSTNVEAIQSLLSMISRDQRVIYPNTNSGYGATAGAEECTEDTPMNPVSMYGRTKMMAEEAVLAHDNAVVFRLATVFGMSPRMRCDLLVNDFVYRAVMDRAVVLFEADFKRNFIHVRDVARAFLHAIDNFDAMKGRPYNVGLSTANLSKRELCDRIAKQIPGFVYVESQIGEDKDKRNYVVSNARIEATGWHPIHTLDAGIAELIKGYQMIRNTVHGNV